MTPLTRAEVLALPELPFSRPSASKSDPRIRSFDIASNRKTRQSQSLSGQILTRDGGAQWFTLKVSYAPIAQEKILPLISFIEQAGGKQGLFRVPVQNFSSGLGATAGHYINYDNDHKLHLITDASAAPALTVSPIPRLLGGVPIYDDPLLVCSLRQDIQAVRVDARGLVRLSLSFVERI